MILTREEFFSNLRKFTEDRKDDDEVLKFVEDMTDTYNDLETKVNDIAETWKKRYWERFFKGDVYSRPNEREIEEDDKVEIDEDITIDELFTEN